MATKSKKAGDKRPGVNPEKRAQQRQLDAERAMRGGKDFGEGQIFPATGKIPEYSKRMARAKRKKG